MERRIHRLEDLYEVMGLTGRATAEIGDWYLVPEALIRRASGQRRGSAFAEKPGMRPCIVVRNWDGSAGDVCRVLPRSTSGGSGFEHDAHQGECEPRPECRLTRAGWVVMAAPAYVPSPGMKEALSSCTEPSGSLRRKLTGQDSARD